ncbi:MAG: CBS domain-containing protein [Pseudomonadales bacterium]
MFRSTELRDYMVHHPVCVRPTDSLFEAIHQILVHKISGLCVTDDDGSLIGVLSEIDCLSGILSSTYNDSGIGLVADVMCTDVMTASPGDDIVDLAADMLSVNHRRRPVVENGKLVGQITVRQVLRAVKEFSAPADPREHNGE